MGYKFGLGNTSNIFYICFEKYTEVLQQSNVYHFGFFMPFHLYMEARITNSTHQLMAQTT